MAEPSTLSEPTTPPAPAALPLLSSLARWFAPASPRPVNEATLGYESAQPWTMFGGLIDTRPSID